jgi:hypothetical protein
MTECEHEWVEDTGPDALEGMIMCAKCDLVIDTAWEDDPR